MKRLFELNDQCLTWHSEHGSACAGPGAALVGDDGVVFGEEALNRSRIQPRGFYNEHWQLLNGESLSISAPGVRNNADLVYQHMQLMQQQLTGGPSTQVTTTVSGLTSPEQLGMLLGILQEAQIPLRSFVDAALLYSLDFDLPEQSYCFDIHNRRGVLTELNRQDGMLVRGEVIAVPQLGLIPVVEGWLDLLVDHFVSRTRFDPLRVAATEQQLFDQVMDWLPGEGPFKPDVDHEGTHRTVDVSLEEMSARAQQRYVTLVKQVPSRATIILTPQATQLPGFEYYLSGHGFTVYSATPETLWANASKLEALFNADPKAVQLVTQLEIAHAHTIAPETTVAVEQINADEIATHLLDDHTARPLANAGHGLIALTQGYGWDVASDEHLVNDSPPVPHQSLRPGDTLSLAGKSYTCIRVTDGTA